MSLEKGIKTNEKITRVQKTKQRNFTMSSGVVTCLCVALVACNAFTAAAAVALFAVAIWVAADGYKLYPISAVSGKTDIFAAAWIAIFTGFALFLTCIFGIYAALKKCRTLILVYLIIMFIIFLFESASPITASTNRDYLVGNSNLVKKQMLVYYGANSVEGQQITQTWNSVMQQAQCCGADGPMDWILYNSTLGQTVGYGSYWPQYCCQSLSGVQVFDPAGCRVGSSSAVFTQGCFQYIQSVFSRYTWAVSWYGFSILMFVFFMLVLAMVYYTQLD